MAALGRNWTPGVLHQPKTTTILASLTVNTPKHAPTLPAC